MILFIAHASEDQPDFVRPLAEALSKEYKKVWYSEYQLTLGDSLLQKIDEGLASCDYGVVVLSKHFFGKKWPRAELDGLFARETQFRKMILPIWKDITEDEVKAYSPILAGRLAVPTTAGLPKVLEEIRLAVSVSDRQRNLTAVDGALQRVQTFRQTMAEKRHAEQLLASEQGAALVSAGVESLWQMVQNVLSAGANELDPVKFGFSKNSLNHMQVRTVLGMYLAIRITNHYSLATNKVLETEIVRRNFDRFNQPTSGDVDFYSAKFKPTFRGRDELAWTDVETSVEYQTKELVDHLVNLFIQHVEEEISGGE
jgi:hypothetical protein